MDFGFRHPAAPFEEIIITAAIGLGNRAAVEQSKTPHIMGFRRNPVSPAERQNCRVDIEVIRRPGHVQGDKIPVFNQRERSTDHGFGRYVEHAGAIAVPLMRASEIRRMSRDPAPKLSGIGNGPHSGMPGAPRGRRFSTSTLGGGRQSGSSMRAARSWSRRRRPPGPRGSEAPGRPNLDTAHRVPDSRARQPTRPGSKAAQRPDHFVIAAFGAGDVLAQSVPGDRLAVRCRWSASPAIRAGRPPA